MYPFVEQIKIQHGFFELFAIVYLKHKRFMPCIWKPEGKCSYRYGATPHTKGAFTCPRFMPCIWKPEGTCSYRYGATPHNKGA